MPFLFPLLHHVDQLLCTDLQHPNLEIHYNIMLKFMFKITKIDCFFVKNSVHVLTVKDNI